MLETLGGYQLKGATLSEEGDILRMACGNQFASGRRKLGSHIVLDKPGEVHMVILLHISERIPKDYGNLSRDKAREKLKE